MEFEELRNKQIKNSEQNFEGREVPPTKLHSGSDPSLRLDSATFAV